MTCGKLCNSRYWGCHFSSSDQFSTTCTAADGSQHHSWTRLACILLFCNFLSLQQRRQWLHMFTTRVSVNSAEQQSRLARFLFKKWQISLGNGIVFPPAPKCYAVQPIMCLQHMHRRLATVPILGTSPAHNGAIPAHDSWRVVPVHWPWLCCVSSPWPCSASCVALPSDCVGEPCVVPVTLVTTAILSPPGSSMSATTNRSPLPSGLVSHS